MNPARGRRSPRGVSAAGARGWAVGEVPARVEGGFAKGGGGGGLEGDEGGEAGWWWWCGGGGRGRRRGRGRGGGGKEDCVTVTERVL